MLLESLTIPLKCCLISILDKNFDTRDPNDLWHVWLTLTPAHPLSYLYICLTICPIHSVILTSKYAFCVTQFSNWGLYPSRCHSQLPCIWIDKVILYSFFFFEGGGVYRPIFIVCQPTIRNSGLWQKIMSLLEEMGW